MNTNVRPETELNVVLLTIDALRADHCSCYGHDRETTPTLDRLAGDGARFENVYSASSHTREAIPALLTGRYPDECVDDGYRLAADSIGTHLRDTGYATGAFHSNPFVSRGYGYGADFDEFDDDLYLSRHRLLALAQRVLDKLRNRHYARAETINEQSLAWLDALDGDRPFFLWNHYMDPHGPYAAPDGYQTVYHDERVRTKDAQELYWRAAAEDPDSVTDAERSEILNCYDEEIRYVDAKIGAFLDELRERELPEETLVVVTADHGDLFGEHGLDGHPRRLYEELLHVPMLLIGDGVSSGGIEAPASTLDVVPTVLDACGVSTESLPGESLLEVSEVPGEYRDRRVFSQARGDGDETHLRRFGVRTVEDRCRVECVIESGAERWIEPEDSKLVGELREFGSRRLSGRSVNDVETGVNEEIQRRLKALGYNE